MDLDQVAEVPAVGGSPEDAFEKIWVDEHLNHCLRLIQGEVDEATYDAFQRYVLDGQDAERVCQDRGLTANQLYKIKHRLTRRLRDLMSTLVGEEFALPT